MNGGNILVSITFKQYLILKKLYKAKPNPVQLSVKDNDFNFLQENHLIDSESDLLDPKSDVVLGFFTVPNGKSTITNLGESTYNSYFDTYINRTGVVASLIISITALIISILKP